MSKKKVKKQTNYIMQDVMTWFTNVYVAVMLLVFPLFYQDKFFNILTAKRLFYYRWTTMFIVVGIIILIVLQIEKHEIISLPKKIDPIPIFCMLLLFSSILCVALNDNPWVNLYHGGGRKFGELVLIYGAIIVLLIGKNLKWNSNIIKCYLIGAGVVFLLEDLNTFMLDPLNMCESLTDKSIIIQYVATLGNVNYASAFNCVTLPLGVFLYLKSSNIRSKLLYGVVLVLGFAGIIACRSDSGMVTLLCILFFLFFLWVRDRDSFGSYIEVIIFFLSAILFMVVLKYVFPYRTFYLTGIIGLFATKIGVLTECLSILVCLSVRICLCKSSRELPIQRMKGMILVLLSIMGVVILMINGIKFQLDDSFGSYRGYIWKRAIMMYSQEYSFVKKLFGCGYYHVELLLDQYYGTEMMDKLGAVFLEVHNEALQYLLSVGLVGAIGYFGVFATLLWKGFQNLKENRAMVFVIIEIVAILVQGLVNGPTVIITPLIFVNLGICYYVLCSGGNDFTQCSIETAGKHNK